MCLVHVVCICANCVCEVYVGELGVVHVFTCVTCDWCVCVFLMCVCDVSGVVVCVVCVFCDVLFERVCLSQSYFMFMLHVICAVCVWVCVKCECLFCCCEC